MERALCTCAANKREQQWKPPSYEDFAAAVRATHGAPGLDGWEREELVALLTHAPWIMQELYDFLLMATKDAGRKFWKKLRGVILSHGFEESCVLKALYQVRNSNGDVIAIAIAMTIVRQG